MDLNATDQLLTTTRSVRKRLDFDRPVDRGVILDCLRLATQAPTGGNTQRWRFVVVTDEDKRMALADLYREAGGEYLRTAAESATDPQSRRVYESAVYLADNLHRAPVHVIPCLLGRVTGSNNGQAAGFYGSIIPAAWSFMLALRARGLGTAWTTIHLHSEREAAAILNIPDDVTQVALLPVAYTIGTDFQPAKRPPVETVTYWNSWE